MLSLRFCDVEKSSREGVCFLAFQESKIVTPHGVMKHRMKMVSFTLRPLYPRGMSLRFSLDMRLSRPQSQPERGRVEEENPARAGNLFRPVHSQPLCLVLLKVHFPCIFLFSVQVETCTVPVAPISGL